MYLCTVWTVAVRFGQCQIQQIRDDPWKLIGSLTAGQGPWPPPRGGTTGAHAAVRTKSSCTFTNTHTSNICHAVTPNSLKPPLSVCICLFHSVTQHHTLVCYSSFLNFLSFLNLSPFLCLSNWVAQSIQVLIWLSVNSFFFWILLCLSWLTHQNNYNETNTLKS